MAGSQKGKKKKMKEEQKGTPLNPLRVTSDGGGRPCNNGGWEAQQQRPHSLLLYDYMQKSLISAGIPEIWWTRSFLLTLAPPGCVQATPVACRVGGYGGCTAANVLRAEID